MDMVGIGPAMPIAAGEAAAAVAYPQGMCDVPRHDAGTAPDVEHLPAFVLQHRAAGGIAGQLPGHVRRQAAAVVGISGVPSVDAVIRMRIVGVDVHKDLVGIARSERRGAGAAVAGGEVVFGDLRQCGGAAHAQGFEGRAIGLVGLVGTRGDSTLERPSENVSAETFFPEAATDVSAETFRPGAGAEDFDEPPAPDPVTDVSAETLGPEATPDVSAETLAPDPAADVSAETFSGAARSSSSISATIASSAFISNRPCSADTRPPNTVVSPSSSKQ